MAMTIPNKKILKEEMREAIEKSGYLIEQRVENILIDKGYYVETNPVFKDFLTEKTREYDIFALAAIQVYRKEDIGFIFPNIICECKNNPQPIVFFTKNSPVPFLFCNEVKYSGIPNKYLVRNEFIDLIEFIKMEKFHHYCTKEISTQYCSFQQKKYKSSWFAQHIEEQHISFNTIIQALESEISSHYDNWLTPEKGEKENVNLTIHYPLLIFQGDIYSCKLEKGEVILKNKNHIQFRKSTFIANKIYPEEYQIDVITESYLPKYIDIIKNEIEKIKKIFQRKKEIVEISISEIIKRVKKINKKNKSNREIFENLE